MSGWACLFRRDGAPVSRTDIEPLMPRLRMRAPDGEAHVACPVDAPTCALAMTILDTHDRVPLARRPVRVGPLTAVGQVRIDAREDVARALGIGFADRVRMTDLELLTRAFLHWGDGVLAHVGGEYSGAMFDERTREVALFRDGFGVRQCFFAAIGPWLVASNSLRALRAHEAVSDALDDDAIVDFLLFDWIMDKEKTAFRDIARLHPGHVLRADAVRVRNVKSWVLELPDVDRRSSMEELGLRWRDALDQAVKERLGERTSIFLSGGIDSTAIAASAARGIEERSRLLAVTAVSSSGDDEEGVLAAQVARHLAIAQEQIPADRLASSNVLATAPLDSPEPTMDPYAWDAYPFYTRAAAHGAVALDGEGGDEIWRAFSIVDLRARVPLGTLSSDVARALVTRVRPDVGSGALRFLMRRPRAPKREPPPWLADAHKSRGAERVAQVIAQTDPIALSAERALGLVTLLGPTWAAATFARDPDVTSAALDVRFPMLDRRVVMHALCVPSLPAGAKQAARRVLRDRLPRSILNRPKTGVDDTLLPRATPSQAWGEVSSTSRIGYYVDVERLDALLLSAPSPEWAQLRPLVLARWLAGRSAT